MNFPSFGYSVRLGAVKHRMFASPMNHLHVFAMAVCDRSPLRRPARRRAGATARALRGGGLPRPGGGGPQALRAPARRRATAVGVLSHSTLSGSGRRLARRIWRATC